MALYRVVARYMAYAECIVEAPTAQDALQKSGDQWPDGQWNCLYGGAELRPPDGAMMVSRECRELSDSEIEKLTGR